MTQHRSPWPTAPLPFQAGLDSLDQGVSIFDGELRLVAWNRRFVELLGLPETVVGPGARFEDLVRHLAERGELGAGAVEDIVARRVRAARECPRFYSERTRPDGRIIAARTSPVTGGGFVTVYTDITARSRVEALTPARNEELEARVNQRTLELRTLNEELRRNIRRLEEVSAAREKGEARLRLICDAIPAAIAYVDEQLTLRFANRFLAERFRRTSDEIIGVNIGELLADRLGELQGPIDRAFRGELATFEHSYQGLDGQARITRNTLIPEWSASGAVLGLFVLSLDVTDEKRAEQGLREAQKISAIGQLAGGLAHDFNNLLTVIVGGLASLEDRIDAELVREFIAPARRASSRGADITRRLLAFARQQSLEPLAVDVPGLIAGTAQLLRRSFASTIAIDCTADGDGWPALADPAQLENAIVNLALNARDAMPDGGVLTLSTTYTHLVDGDASGPVPPGDYVEIRVSDTGTGIPPAVRDRVLEPFFTTKPFGAGSGLGLSMVFGFARQSGGDLRIDSTVGRGTCVTLLLPRAEGAVAVEIVAEADSSPVVAGQGQLVLLVEDHDDVRLAVRRQLLELGYQVLEARDGEDARSLLAAGAGISALVSDIVMPGALDGVDLAQQARQLIPGIKIVLISGFTDALPGDRGGHDSPLVLRKPFHKDQLARALQGART